MSEPKANSPPDDHEFIQLRLPLDLLPLTPLDLVNLGNNLEYMLRWVLFMQRHTHNRSGVLKFSFEDGVAFENAWHVDFKK